MVGQIDWAPMNSNYGRPYTWQPNTQWPPPSNINGYMQDRSRSSQQFNNILRVSGPESAKAYYMPPNSQGVMFDADEPIFYWKSTDDSGFPTLRTFKFEEITPVEVKAVVEQPAEKSPLEKDVEDLKTDILIIKEMLEGLVK